MSILVVGMTTDRFQGNGLVVGVNDVTAEFLQKGQSRRWM